MLFIPCFLLVETNKYMQYKGNVRKKNYFASLVLPIFPIFENTMQQICYDDFTTVSCVKSLSVQFLCIEKLVHVFD